MVKRLPLMVILGRSTWQVVRRVRDGVETTAPAAFDITNPADAAHEIRAALAAWHANEIPVVLALESAWCVSAVLPLPRQKQAQRRQALSYLLEPFLPWSAEEAVADYEFSKTDAFATAIALEPIADLVSHLEEIGVLVESIAPLARLALERELARVPMQAPRYLLLWADGDSMELWLIDHNRPILWRRLELDAAGVQQELKQITLDEPQPLPLAAWGVPEEWTATLPTLSDSIRLEPPNGAAPSVVGSAIETAGDLLAGTKGSPIEFRRDGLAPRDRHRSIHASLQAVQIALLSLLMAIGFALYKGGNQFDEQRRQAGDRQADLFRRLFPGAPVPVGVRSRLESERAKLLGMRGDNVELPEYPSALRLVEHLLRSLPADLRCRVLEVRVEQGRLYVVGQVREHADADRIAEELRKTSLVVDNPSTHRLPQRGVEFRLSARFPKPAPSSSEVKL